MQDLCKRPSWPVTRAIVVKPMAEILVVDDDGHIREVVRFALTRAGHTVREAADGRAALQAIAERTPDLMVLDILMPELDGIATCRTVRRTSRLPIIFLSSRDEELDRVLGLELGGDDYVSKPFSPRELVARVAALLRRAAPEPPPSASETQLLQSGALQLDLARHRCQVGANELVLTVTEFDLLAVLVGAPGRVFSRAQLITQAYGDDHHVTERTVDSHVRRLRKKLTDAGVDPIETVYGVGYRLREAAGQG
ncbi:MAG TPA: response regulator transcription factor [Polyangiales bacterium]|nr:response regulator transcription factor [Polyangiales bacterium]